MTSRFTSTAVGLSLLVALTMGASADVPTSTDLSAGYDPAFLDKSASPATDFYQYAVGGWKASHPVPAELPEYDASTEVEEANWAKLHQILDDAAAGSKLGDYYRSGMDENAINQAGLAPLKPDLDAIQAVRSVAGLAPVIARLHTYEIPVFFSLMPDQDAKNSTVMLAEFNQDGLGLPDRDYYLKTDKKSRTTQVAYQKHVGRMFELAGESADVATRHATVVYRYETALARASKTNVELRDPATNYHKISFSELGRRVPGFPWGTYFSAIGCPTNSPINLSQPEYLQAVGRIWQQAPLEDTRTYLRWHLLHHMAPYLSDAFVNEDFNFSGKTLKGLESIRPRWKRVVRTIDQTMGEELGQAYVARYFPPEAKADALKMVNNLKQVLRDDLATLSWMSPATRRKAIEKLNTMHAKIGYPDHWRDYSGLTIDSGLYVSNVQRALKFDFAFDMHKIGRPVDRTLWDMTPPTVNAYYNPAMNEIVFPAGILQPPFFDPKQDDAYNYGGMGATIGHEMTHGFDDQGAQYDARGNLRNWWTKADLAQFTRRTVAIQKLFDSYHISDGLHANGKLESGEAIADLGGLKIAYRAYENSLKGKYRTNDDNGFTPEQRFFLGFALSWACNDRPQYQRLMLLTNPHPLEEFRVRGSVSNLPEFANAWKLKPGDPMVLPPDQRTEIW